jgi:hypothetical protein
VGIFPAGPKHPKPGWAMFLKDRRPRSSRAAFDLAGNLVVDLPRNTDAAGLSDALLLTSDQWAR